MRVWTRRGTSWLRGAIGMVLEPWDSITYQKRVGAAASCTLQELVTLV